MTASETVFLIESMVEVEVEEALSATRDDESASDVVGGEEASGNAHILLDEVA